jgi:spore coat polysaccharide biosynthesis protein SpsF
MPDVFYSINMSVSAIAIIQARMASSRLPGKVLLDIGGQPMLSRVVVRAQRARSVAQVVVATTTDPSDDPVERLCRERSYPCYRGSAQDVLDRYYQAARLHAAEIVVRITADCPAIDPGLVDEAVTALLGQVSPSGQQRATVYDFVANRLPPPWGRTYPIGLDVEACTFAGLETAWKEAHLPHQREHVMPFFYENPERFRICLLNHDTDLSAYRWTVDTAEDLELMRQVYSRFDGRDDFSWLEVLALFEREPGLAQINAQVQHKHYREIDGRHEGLFK